MAIRKKPASSKQKKSSKKDMIFKDQEVAFVTGCSSGIGLATALYLARKGIFVYATMRNTRKGTQLRLETKRSMLPIHILQLDVNKPQTIKSAIKYVEEHHDRIDYLINKRVAVHKEWIADRQNRLRIRQHLNAIDNLLHQARTTLKSL